VKKSLIFFTVLLTAIFSYSCAAWAGVPSEVIPSNELEGSALETSVDNIIPESVNDTYEVDQDTTLEIDAPGVLENDSDADEDELTVVVVSEPTNGTLTINEDGSFTYTPDAGFIGEDTFTYQAYDGEAYSEAAIVKITVLKVNTAPEAVDDEYDVSQDTVLEIAASGVLANDSDAKCDELTAEVVSGPGNGTLTFNDDGSFTYIPNEGFTGLDTFKYKAYDGEAYSNIATVMITVLKVKTAPVAEDDFFEMDENTELVVSAPGVLENDSDVDGDELTAVLVSEPSNGWIDFYSDGSFTYYPDYGFSGQDTFTYKVFDGNANSYEATVSIEVYDTVLEIYGWDLEDGEYSLDDLSFLEDMENLKVLRLSSALSPDANLEPLAGLTGLEELVLYDCNLNNSDLQYLAGLTNLRVLELSWNSISDLSALSRLTSLRALDLSGNNISDLRALSGCINLEWLWLWSNNIDLSTLPQSLANLTILDLSENEIGNIDEDMGAILSNLKNLDYLALDNCKLKDISGLRMLASLERLRVLSLNDNNIQSIVPLKSLTNLGHIYPYENHIYLYENYDINFSDQANIDAYETLINNGVYVYLSQDSYLENTAPVAGDDFFEMDENTELAVSAPGVLENDSDVDGDELTAVLVSEPSNGWIDFYSDGSFTYYPDYGFSGQDTFTYKVFDGNANSYEATVSIEVYDTVLEIYGWDLEDGEYSLDDLSFLEDMENLKVLRLSSALSPDANLEPLAGLTGLEELVLYDCNLNNSDLQYLAGLTNLRVLELSWNSISDLSALSRLTSLRALDLSGNNISDLRALSGCINLEWLWLWSNNIDLSTLPQSLANLTILDLSWNNVSDLSVLSGYSNLQDLNLRSNNIDLSTLPQNLANLTILDLSENEIGNIDEDMGAILSNLKNLDYLALDNCKLKDISGLRMLASLERLRVLSLNDNNIQSIVPLKSLTNLGHIYPYENHIYLYENYDINFSDQANIDAYETLINNGVYVYLSQDSYLENTAPVAGDDFFEMDENTELAVSAPGVLENDSDADGDELTAVLVSEPSHGWIDFYSDGSFTYYPDYGFSGQDSFTYKAFDGNANSYEVTVTIEVLDTVLEIYGWDLPYGAYSLDDLSFLEDIENLKVLRLWNALSPDANFEPLAGLTGLEELVLFDCNLDNNDLQYLANLIGLRVLNLSWNNINDFTFLSGLTNLEQLSLWSCEIEDISSFPKNLINLRVLDLEDNYINDLGALSGFTNLENLHLAWNCIESLRTFPQSLTKLRVLDLGGNKISDLSALSECINLEDLWLWSNNIQDLSTLPQNLINLICLDLSRNKITDISALSVFTNLETLSLSCNDFGNIDEDKGAILSQLTNLNYLNLDDCELNDISGLSMMASLENLSMLSLRSNNFQSIVPLAILTNLFDLYLYDNYDIDFNNPANIEALETLRNRGVYVYLSEDGNNSAPVALDDFYQVAQNAELIISAPGVLGNDWDDGDELQAELVRGPLNGTLTFNKDGAFTYIPNKGFTGKDTFTYKVFDGKAHSEIVTVTITVIEVSPDSKVPTGVAVTDGPKSTTITWNPVSEAVKYNIYRSYSSGKYYELIGTVDGQTYSYKDNSIVEPITYYYVVTSVNENNQESAFSIEGAVSFPEPPYVGAGYYEDTDDSLIYSGEWEEKSNEAASGGSFYCTSVPNASVTLFLSSGSEISILATKYPDGGIADIYVDGKKVGTVDFYSPTTLWKEKIFTISDLSWDTFHRVDIVATGTKNPSSSGYYINLDSLNIISDGDYSFELKAPRNVTATKDSDSVTISWEPYRHACEEDHYYIYRSNYQWSRI
jgi:Leucine-rich repeat (LRR) protein